MYIDNITDSSSQTNSRTHKGYRMAQQKQTTTKPAKHRYGDGHERERDHGSGNTVWKICIRTKKFRRTQSNFR